MATYKKRGGKPKKPKVTDDELAFQGESTTKEVFDTLDKTANRSEQWLEKNQKVVFGFISIVLVGILAFVAYSKFIKAPKEVTAVNELAYAKAAFMDAENASVGIDSLYTIALNGADGKYGLVDIAKKYSSTKAGNMANYMAGMAFLKLNEYKKAIDHLNKFSSEDEALAPLAKGNIGDAFADLNQLDEAFKYYKQAANITDNNFFTPLYLFKAGNMALETGKFDEGVVLFQRIKDDYPKSDEAKQIDAYINRAKYATRK